MEDLLILENGKYKFYKVNGILKCDRYDEPWRDFLGDNAVNALYDELVEVKQNLITLEGILEAHK